MAPRLLRRRRSTLETEIDRLRQRVHENIQTMRERNARGTLLARAGYQTRSSHDEYGNLIVEMTEDDGRNWQIVYTETVNGRETWYPFDPNPGGMAYLNQSIRDSLAENARLRALPGRSMSQRRDDSDALRAQMEDVERLRQQVEEQARAFRLGGITLQSASGELVLNRGRTGDIVFNPGIRPEMLGTTVFPVTGFFRAAQGSVMMPSASVRAWMTDDLGPPQPEPPPVPDLDRPDPNPIPEGVNPRAWGVIEALGKELKGKKDVEQGSA